jgi:hypothetical protein
MLAVLFPLSNRARLTYFFEVAWIVHHLNPRKAAGPDELQSQHLPRLVFKPFAKVFTRSLAPNYFPKQRKEAKIIIHPRPGEESAEFCRQMFFQKIT